MATKNVLGRGLGALIDSGDVESGKAQVDAISEVAIRDIEANPWQPRTKFDEEALEELSESIRQIGIIQPVTVRVLESGKYQLITGERRFRAAKKIGLKKIPAYIRLADDQNMLEMALVENIQREDLNAIEVAITYQRLMEECSLTQENLSDRVGKNRATISNYLRLLKLPAEIQLGLRDRKISMGHARALINLEDVEDQQYVYDETVKNDLSVRKVEELVRKLQDDSKSASKPGESKEKESLPKEYNDLKTHLSKHFGTKVDFRRSTKGSGKIVIPFTSDEELERIIAILDKLNA
ncbi:MAG: ParB/RepB/Spo0J family partition protein [Bacteroidales bacterium]|nr:ParB/RepB/Spo0J family partition protein [Bacteroidales bacterium]MCB8999706.1 ParB/RepB/Spo0J family partition protein [Bacteroidales bacterium]